MAELSANITSLRNRLLSLNSKRIENSRGVSRWGLLLLSYCKLGMAPGSDGSSRWVNALTELKIQILELVHAARTEVALSIDGPDITAVENELEDETRARNFAGPSKDAVARFLQHGMSSSKCL